MCMQVWVCMYIWVNECVLHSSVGMSMHAWVCVYVRVQARGCGSVLGRVYVRVLHV